MTKKQLLEYYNDYKKRMPPVDEVDRMFLAGMKHILVIQGIIKGNND